MKKKQKLKERGSSEHQWTTNDLKKGMSADYAFFPPKINQILESLLEWS